MLAALLPPWAHASGPEGVLAYLADPAAAARIAREVETGLPDWEGFVPGAGWENIRISGIGNGLYPDLIGKSLAEIAEDWQSTPFAAMTRLLTEAELDVSMIVHAMHEDDVAAIMRAPWRTGGTDALLGGKPHPRTYGSYPRILGYFVRERGILSLSQAIHQMTGAAARRLRLRDRGTIALGNWADLVVFDPETIRDTATYVEPEQFPIGIAAILVNGEPVARDGQPIGTLPGHLLRQH
jgi:N-acyl-D-amino-acid deacylase